MVLAAVSAQAVEKACSLGSLSLLLLRAAEKAMEYEWGLVLVR